MLNSGEDRVPYIPLNTITELQLVPEGCYHSYSGYYL